MLAEIPDEGRAPMLQSANDLMHILAAQIFLVCYQYYVVQKNTFVFMVMFPPQTKATKTSSNMIH